MREVQKIIVETRHKNGWNMWSPNSCQKYTYMQFSSIHKMSCSFHSSISQDWTRFCMHIFINCLCSTHSMAYSCSIIGKKILEQKGDIHCISTLAYVELLQELHSVKCSLNIRPNLYSISQEHKYSLNCKHIW